MSLNYDIFLHVWYNSILFGYIGHQYQDSSFHVCIISMRGVERGEQSYQQVGKYKINVWDLKWLYSTSIHLIWYYRQALVHFISMYTYINSLRQVPHHHIICTSPRVGRPTCYMWRLSQGRTFRRIILVGHNILLCMISWYIGWNGHLSPK